MDTKLLVIGTSNRNKSGHLKSSTLGVNDIEAPKTKPFVSPNLLRSNQKDFKPKPETVS